MTLYEGQVGKRYLVEGMQMEEETARRLQALGLIEGTDLKLLNRKKSGSMIVYVRGTRLAMGRHITSAITVREAEKYGQA